jgi:hypothetical protein
MAPPWLKSWLNQGSIMAHSLLIQNKGSVHAFQKKKTEYVLKWPENAQNITINKTFTK